MFYKQLALIFFFLFGVHLNSVAQTCVQKTFSLAEEASPQSNLPINFKISLCQNYKLFTYKINPNLSYSYLVDAPDIEVFNAAIAKNEDVLSVFQSYLRHQLPLHSSIYLITIALPPADPSAICSFSKYTNKFSSESLQTYNLQQAGEIVEGMRRMDQNKIPILVRHVTTNLKNEYDEAEFHFRSSSFHAHVDLVKVQGEISSKESLDNLEMLVQSGSYFIIQ